MCFLDDIFQLSNDCPKFAFEQIDGFRHLMATVRKGIYIIFTHRKQTWGKTHRLNLQLVLIVMCPVDTLYICYSIMKEKLNSHVTYSRHFNFKFLSVS